MPTIDDTVGGSSSNSYISLANANLYFDNRLYSEVWECEKIPNKQKALITATKHIDYKFDFFGIPADLNDQALDWPRNIVYDQDGQLVDGTIIPVFVLDATCELAIELLKEDRVSDYSNKGLDSIKVGPIDIDFDSDYDQNLLPDTVLEMLSFFGDVTTRGGGTNVPVTRV